MSKQDSFSFESKTKQRKKATRRRSSSSNDATNVDERESRKGKSNNKGRSEQSKKRRIRSNASDLAKAQRDISVSEFFAKNRQQHPVDDHRASEIGLVIRQAIANPFA